MEGKKIIMPTIDKVAKIFGFAKLLTNPATADHSIDDRLQELRSCLKNDWSAVDVEITEFELASTEGFTKFNEVSAKLPCKC